MKCITAGSEIGHRKMTNEDQRFNSVELLVEIMVDNESSYVEDSRVR